MTPWIQIRGKHHDARHRRGSALVEFVLVGSFIFLPLLAGTATVGMSVLRSQQVITLSRDAGHMFATGVDFSQASNKNLLVKIAGDLHLTTTGGNGVIILSEISGTGNNTAVCVRRIVIGNAALRNSSYVSPSASVLGAAGAVTNQSDPSASVNADFTAMMPLGLGETAYLAETYFTTADLDWAGLLTGTGIYSRVVF